MLLNFELLSVRFKEWGSMSKHFEILLYSESCLASFLMKFWKVVESDKRGEKFCTSLGFEILLSQKMHFKVGLKFDCALLQGYKFRSFPLHFLIPNKHLLNQSDWLTNISSLHTDQASSESQLHQLNPSLCSPSSLKLDHGSFKSFDFVSQSSKSFAYTSPFLKFMDHSFPVIGVISLHKTQTLI